MRRKLLDDVSMQELYGMREQGLSNTEIAERLDCSYVTVLRYMGKSDNRRERRAITPKPVKESKTKMGALDVISVQVTLKGVNTYCVNTETGVVEIRDGLIKGILDKDCIGEIIRELTEIQGMLHGGT